MTPTGPFLMVLWRRAPMRLRDLVRFSSNSGLVAKVAWQLMTHSRLRAKQTNISLEEGSPRLLLESRRYSKTPNGPPLCHSRSALSQPFAHSNDTLSIVRVLDH